MDNPKTTIAGWVGLLGTVLLTTGTMLPPGNTQKLVSTFGAVLIGGASGVGNIASKDGRDSSIKGRKRRE